MQSRIMFLISSTIVMMERRMKSKIKHRCSAYTDDYFSNSQNTDDNATKLVSYLGKRNETRSSQHVSTTLNKIFSTSRSLSTNLKFNRLVKYIAKFQIPLVGRTNLL